MLENWGNNMVKNRNQCGRFPVGKFFMWKTRDISAASLQLIVTSYLAIFCTNALGLEAALVGMLMMASKVFDGVPDLFAGYLIDNTNSRLGKARPYEFAIIGAWGCTVLLFFASPQWSSTIKAVWVFAMYTMVFSVFNTLLNANQTPYMIRAFSNDYQIIAKVSSYGGIVSMAGAIVISVTFPILMAKLAANSEGWRILILIYALPLCLIGILRFVFVREEPAVDADLRERVHIKEIFLMLVKNKYCLIYAAITGFYQISVSFGAGTYYYTYVIGDISKFGIVSMFSIIMLPIMFLFPTMMKMLSITKIFVVFSVIAVTGYITIFFGNTNLPVVVAGGVCVTLLNLPLGYLGTLIVKQLSTYNEYIKLPRMESSCSAITAFTGKIGQGIGAGLSGILLGISGFVSSTSDVMTVQSAGAILMIRCLYCVFPCICVMFIIILSILLGKLEKEIIDKKTLEEKR